MMWRFVAICGDCRLHAHCHHPFYITPAHRQSQFAPPHAPFLIPRHETKRNETKWLRHYKIHKTKSAKNIFFFKFEFFFRFIEKSQN